MSEVRDLMGTHGFYYLCIFRKHIDIRDFRYDALLYCNTCHVELSFHSSTLVCFQQPLMFSCMTELLWSLWEAYPCYSSESSLYDMFYITWTKELFDQGVWCVIVRNSGSLWLSLSPNATLWPWPIHREKQLGVASIQR